MIPVTTAAGLRNELDRARTITDALFEVVRPEAWYDRPIPERHRNIFYAGHLEAFDWNLIAAQTGTPGFHNGFDRLFAFGIDPGSDDLPHDEPQDWPRLEEVLRYNHRVRETLDRLLDRTPEQLLHVAIEHRLMHAETFAYMLHNMPYDRKASVRVPAARWGAAPDTRFIEVPAGTARLGADRDAVFGWDNEFAAHEVSVPAFAIGKYKVTNGDYLRFVETGAAAPRFWRRRGREWMYRGMFSEIPLPLDWPVYCTHRQAAEYASWTGHRLPTEPELQRASWGGVAHPLPDGRGSESGFVLSREREPAVAAQTGMPDPEGDNFDFRRWDPIPVTASRENPFGLSQTTGNGWEWTATTFHPFEGFEPLPFYPGYSANFFDGEHYVLKGASPRTAARLARPSFRNWFRPDYPYIYATFRLVEGR